MQSMCDKENCNIIFHEFWFVHDKDDFTRTVLVHDVENIFIESLNEMLMNLRE